MTAPDAFEKACLAAFPGKDSRASNKMGNAERAPEKKPLFRPGDRVRIDQLRPICTLCSCYPRPVLGLPPDWYKQKAYRAQAVIEPRAVLAEFGTVIPDDVEVRVSDSTAMVRYLVLPERPNGTDSYSEEQLAELVTRDAMRRRSRESGGWSGGDLMSTANDALVRLPNDVDGLNADPVAPLNHELKPREKDRHALAGILDFQKGILTPTELATKMEEVAIRGR